MESIDSVQNALESAAEGLFSPKVGFDHLIALLNFILENSSDVIFGTDADGKLIACSREVETLLGYRWDELADSPLESLAFETGRFQEFLSSAMQTPGVVRSEMPFHHRDGHPVPCEVCLLNLKNGKGVNTGLVAVCRDLTPSKKLQEDLIRVDRLAEIGRLASGIVHDINNPLANINEIAGWAGVVVSDAVGLSQEDREELETAIKRIGEQTERCRRLAHQLLGFARGPGPAKTVFDVHDTLEKTVRFLEPELKHRNIEILFDFVKGPLTARSDPKMLEQVFVNLISNAIYAVKEKGESEGRISIRTIKVGPEMEILISDNGTGISEANQKKIFELFFTTKPPGKGTGLGIPISRNILRKLGGDMTFESEEGVGTKFSVRIPISKGD